MQRLSAPYLAPAPLGLVAWPAVSELGVPYVLKHMPYVLLHKPHLLMHMPYILMHMPHAWLPFRSRSWASPTS